MEPSLNESIDLGTWIGRGQAFGVIANGCTAAQAECLRQINESGTYKQTGLSWDDFCQQYVGLSRPRVDSLIKSLAEFGKTFFDLSNIVRISPEAYRRVAANIKDQSIQIGADLVPIVPENAARIRRAVQHYRSEMEKARSETRALNCDTNLLMMNLENCFQRMDELASDNLISKGQYETLGHIVEWVRCQADRIERCLENSPRAPRD
jgi:hypothetical protein